MTLPSRWKSLPAPARTALGLLLAAFLLAVYLYGARQQLTLVNTDMTAVDQSAYMAEAIAARESGYTALTGRNRMPAYLYLQSLLYTPGLSNSAYFARGKTANVVLSIAMLVLLGFIFRRFLPGLTSFNLLLITAFTVFIYKAAYFQADLLFYGLSFATFLLLARLLSRPQWPWALAAGVVAGLAHLTKASVLPGLLVFGGTAVLQALLVKQRRRPALVTAVVLIAAFLATLSPYLRHSKAHFGHYFYNVNSTFYIWYDSWAEVEQGTKAHGDRLGWPDLPPEEIPSAARYLREHTPAQIGQRLWLGFLAVLSNMLFSYGYFKYLLLYAIFLATVAAVNWGHTRLLWQRYPFLILFAGGTFAIYILLYSWYAPIAAGNRLSLALFLPLLFSAAWLLYRHYASALPVPLSRQSRRYIDLGLAFNVAILSLLAVDIIRLLSGGIVSIFGGF